MPPTHPNVWQVRELAKCIGECGYNVDVFDFFTTHTPIVERYDMVVDIHPRLMPFYRENLTQSCIKIAYLTNSHSTSRNSSESSRLEGVERRRGMRLLPRRQLDPIDNVWLRSADAMFFKGNQRNLSTYGENHSERVYFIKNSGYDFLTPLHFAYKRPLSFLFIASHGQVHKGLDLVLECFAVRPYLELFVCSMFGEEEDFCSLYKRELYETPNIHPIGFVDIRGQLFRYIADRCSFAILPSCSEGISASVLTAMSAGVIPIVSRECGFEEDEVFHLRESTIDEIGMVADQYACKSPTWIKAEANRILTIAKERYSAQQYTRSVRAALSGVMERVNPRRELGT
ncbi:MAG: hypothetical protein C5B58_04060 [Acidobacteria bacterium]|nr:MAG: hypothetical protein C5B58_04060 [Acidobacteriota bacterium]